MNKIVLISIGVLFIVLGLDSIFSGHSIGFSAKNFSGRSISFDLEPIEFCLSVLFDFIFGIWLVRDNITGSKG